MMVKNNNNAVNKILILIVVWLGFGFAAAPVHAVVDGAVDHDGDSSSFDHLGTGYALVGAHAQLACQECHTDGVFNNLATQCADCHNNELAEGVSANHIPVTQSCDVCHTMVTFSTTNSPTMDHSTVESMACSSCHDNVTATGKSAEHLQTSLECDNCHNVNSWVTSSFDHSSIGNQSCIDCHNGTQATGKSSQHINTSDYCNACHSTNSWVPVTTVDHGQVAGSCSSCHDGVAAKGKGPNHIVTTSSCNTCHTTTSWVTVFDHANITGQACIDCHNGTIASGKTATHINSSDNCDACHAIGPTPWKPVASVDVDHNEVVGVCSSCHDGNIATGQSTTHIQTTEECDVCHSTTQWTPAAVDHTNFVNNCIDCHNGTNASGKGPSHINSSDVCDACHEKFPSTWSPVTPTAVDHTQVSGTCISCHNSTIASGKSASHINSSDNCDACHAPGPTPWQPVGQADVDHNEVTGTCVSCHDSTTASGKSTSHINTSDNCSACHAPGPTPWQPVAPADVDHNEVLGICSSCHDGTIATGQSATHIQTTEECDMCHSTDQWTPASVDHTNFVNNCIDCHNGTDASGKSATHINTSDLCDTCHEKFPATWAPVAPESVDHNQVVGTCISCHDGTIASGKSTSHINTTDNCDACHAPGPTPWQPVAPAHVDHNEVVGTCASCHDGTIASGKSTSHINTTDNCNACHAPGPTPWQPVAPADVDHNELVGTCASCHDGTIASGKSASHINSSDNCDACHAPGPTPWQPVAPADVDHKEVVGTCASCHDGTIASGKSASHINTTDNCDACHAPGPTPWQPVAPADVDHNEVLGVCSSCHDGVIATGQSATHIQTTEECDVCHSTAQWTPAAVDHTNFVNNCIDCHNGTNASGKSATHINTTDLCDACHEKFPATWTPVAPASVDHAQVIGTCVSCHEGTIASGKNATHINSSDNCDACHAPGPTPWQPVAPADVDHKEVVGTCASCHDGTIASGKSTSHINTTDNCDACHAAGPTPWQPVAPADVDHNEVLGVCSSCHDGTIATGQSATHIQTTEECDVCHSTAQWTPAAVDHTNFVNNCIDCHNGTNASGKSATHINTTELCDACHEKFPATWTPVAPVSVDHAQVIGTCISCHDGTIASGKSTSHINSSDNCDVCHAPGPTPWQPVAPADVDHNEVVGVCASCHDGAIASGKSTSHINSSDNCDACHAPGPTPWQPVASADVDHNEVVGTCSSCHDGTIASGKSTSHINTTDNCDACHAAGPMPWQPLASADVDHNEVVGTCSSCHDGTIASGKSVSHINTTDNCDACHAPGPTPWQPVAPADVDHNEVLGVCSSCHDGAIATGKSATHIQTTEECDVCHSTDAWTPAGVDHTNFVNNCIDCHNGTDASGKNVTHINTTDLCDACHEKFPATWAPVAPASVDHAQVIGTCISCHDGTIASGRSASHINSSDNCDACHAPGPAPWQPVAPADVDHNEVVGTCASCHDGTVASGKSTSHISTTDNCDACHAPGPTPWQPVAPADVDHNEVVGTCASCHDGTVASGKSTSHINTTDNCDACHAPGPTPWQPVAPPDVDHNEVVGTCTSCHDGTTASGKSTSHINTTDNCDACHAPGPTPWAPVAPADVDHNEVLGTCSSCHDGVIATGQDPGHVQTTEECGVCHLTTAWLPATVDHSNFTTNCVRCHDGVSATGKTATHLNTSDACETCHQVFPATWTPVAPADVDHNEVVGSCSSCHDGTVASGKSASHINTTDNCDACHAVGPTPWQPVAPADVDHNEVLGVCSSCHDGIIATGQSATHIQTTEECDVCHSTTQWTPAAVDHTNFVNNCIDCHNGTNASGKSATHINSTDQCDACHEKYPSTWAPVAPGAVDHSQVIGSCSSCHDGTIASGKSATHINSSDNCDACHAPGPTPWAPVASADVDHNEVIGTCASCHNGTTASGKSATHINTTDNCDACHAPGPALWAPVAPADVDHNEVVGTCASCHDGTTASGKSATHINTTDNCDACHTPGPTPWAPVASADVDHNEVIGTCVSCHDGTTAMGKGATHINTTDNCDACHAPGPTPWQPVAPADVDHNEVIGTCSSCHDGVIATGKTATHIQTSEECDVCHNVGAWLPAAVDHTGFVNNCISCHNGTDASGKSATHINSSDICDACHQPFPATWAPVAASAVDHNQVIGSCASCHDGIVASGKSAGHINTSDNCDACHAPGPAAWTPVAPDAVDHNEVIGTCVSCHDGTVALGKGPAHINTTDVCDACHQPGPALWAPAYLVDHNEVLGACSSCHDGVIATGQDPGHVQTTLDCGSCHLTTAWLPATVDHSTFTTNCVRCHDGVSATGKGATHINTTDACETCHEKFPATWAPVAPSNVDHSQVIGSCVSCHDGSIASGKTATHIASSDICDACHEPGPTPWAPVAPSAVDHNQVLGTCISCHDGTVATGKGASHINSSDNCDACHATAPSPWAPVASSDVDHNEVIGSCASCHDNVIATGKPATHINTTNVCETCHQPGPTPWAPVASNDVDHDQVIGTCVSCHDNVTAVGKGSNHINSSDNCNACHLPAPTPWAPLAPEDVDHNEVIGSCMSCHDNVIALGKPATHIQTTDNCSACHAPGPTPWVPAITVDHNEVLGTCSTCHDGVTATGKTTDHIQTNGECDVCHNTSAWLPAGVDHTNFTNNCIECHDGTTATGKSASHINTTDVCDACHEKFPATWTPVPSSSVDHSQVFGTCISCHDGNTATGKGASHINTSDNCAACHQPGPTPWIPVSAQNVDHNEVIGTCVSCHDNSTAPGKPGDHPTTTDNCGACHITPPGGWTSVNMDHSEVTGCESCHDGGIARGKNGGHCPTTQDCDYCHNTSSFGNAFRGC